MVQFVIVGAMQDFIPNRPLGKVKPEWPFIADWIAFHPNELDATNSRILSRIFRKAFCLAQIILTGRIVRFKNIDNIIGTITTDD